MALVQIAKRTFNDEKTGKNVEYERLCIIGYLDGVTHTLEVKLEKSELMLAKILLNSKGEKAQVTLGDSGDPVDPDGFLDEFEV
jgi:hypothetical protein